MRPEVDGVGCLTRVGETAEGVQSVKRNCTCFSRFGLRELYVEDELV